MSGLRCLIQDGARAESALGDYASCGPISTGHISTGSLRTCPHALVLLINHHLSSTVSISYLTGAFKPFIGEPSEGTLIPSHHKWISLNAKDGSRYSQCAKSGFFILILCSSRRNSPLAADISPRAPKPRHQGQEPHSGRDSLLLGWAPS